MGKISVRDSFIAIMAQEYPKQVGLVETLTELMRLAKRHGRLQEKACNESVPDGHDAKCEERIRKVIAALPGCGVVFSGDPRGCTVKLTLPSKRTNDWSGIGVCVPQ